MTVTIEPFFSHRTKQRATDAPTMTAASKPKKDRKRAAPKLATPRGVQKKKQQPEALQETAQAALTAGQAGTHPYVGAAVVLPLTQACRLSSNARSC